MAIPIDKAEFLALFLESIIYGIFLTFFILLFAISFIDKDVRKVTNQRFILPVATLMMALATTHLVVLFTRALQAFVTGDVNRQPSPIEYYGRLANPLRALKTAAYALQTTLGDAVLVWRCYIICGKKLYVIIPASIILFGNLAIGMVVTWSLYSAPPGKNIFQTATQFIEAFFILTMILNLCCTLAIVAKIWVTRRHSTTTISSRSFVPVIAALIESGAIYTIGALGMLVAYFSQSNGQYTAVDAVTPLVGVTYCLIVLQIHFHLRISSSSKEGATSNFSIPEAWRRGTAATEINMRTDSNNHKPYALSNSVAVHITEYAETHTDQEFPFPPPKTHFDGT